MTTIAFAKGQGTGNDFVLISDPDGVLTLDEAQVAALCDRHFGVGADGLIRAVRTTAIDEAAWWADEAEWFMDYRNADGSIAEMCGNGVRVFVRYLLEQGLASIEPGSTLPIATRAGIKDVTASASGFQVDMGRWRLQGSEPLVRAHNVSVARPGLAIDVGNPHVVVALADADELIDADLTVPPVVEPALPGGENVEFVVPDEPLVKDGVGRIRMRVHERGSGETLSCGTGAVAAALAVRHWAGPSAPNTWSVRVPGGTLQVRMFPTEDGEHVGLAGPADLVFAGSLDLG